MGPQGTDCLLAPRACRPCAEHGDFGEASLTAKTKPQFATGPLRADTVTTQSQADWPNCIALCSFDRAVAAVTAWRVSRSGCCVPETLLTRNAWFSALWGCSPTKRTEKPYQLLLPTAPGPGAPPAQPGARAGRLIACVRCGHRTLCSPALRRAGGAHSRWLAVAVSCCGHAVDYRVHKQHAFTASGHLHARLRHSSGSAKSASGQSPLP
jgi:hypothetical protein